MTVKLYVTYQQVLLFDPALQNPFNSWTDEHVNQGFSWRNGSVAFGTLEPDGNIEIEIESRINPSPSSDVIRAIIVPFNLPDGGKVELATITESQLLDIPQDVKGLLFEAGVGGQRNKYKITFIKGESPASQILVADAELVPPNEYLMEAEPG